MDVAEPMPSEANSGSRTCPQSDDSVSRGLCGICGMALMNHPWLGKGRRMNADHIEIRRLVREDAADAVLHRDIGWKPCKPTRKRSVAPLRLKMLCRWVGSRIGSAVVRCSARSATQSW